MTITKTLDRTVRLYRQTFVAWLPFVGAGILLGIPGLLLMPVITTPKTGLPPGYFGKVAIGGLFGLVFGLVQHGAGARVAWQVVQDRPPLVADAYRVAVTKALSLIGAGMLVGLVAGMAALLLIVPGLYVFSGLGLTGFVVVAENQSAIGAFKRSWALTQGARWRVFGLLFIWGLLGFVLTSAAAGVVGLVPWFGIRGRMFAQQLGWGLMSPCFAISLALVYQEVRRSKEGTDLEMAARNLAVEREASLAR